MIPVAKKLQLRFEWEYLPFYFQDYSRIHSRDIKLGDKDESGIETIPGILALRMWWQEDQELKVILNYTVSKPTLHCYV